MVEGELANTLEAGRLDPEAEFADVLEELEAQGQAFILESHPSNSVSDLAEPNSKVVAQPKSLRSTEANSRVKP